MSGSLFNKQGDLILNRKSLCNMILDMYLFEESHSSAICGSIATLFTLGFWYLTDNHCTFAHF